jgi:hypothetical protein
MSSPLSFSADIKEIVKSKLEFPLLLSLGFFAILTLMILYGTLSEGFLIVFAVMLALPLIFLTIRYPKFWIYTIALSNIIFLNSRGSDITPVEILIVSEYLATIMIWLFWEIFVNRNKIIDNLADLAIIFFVVFIFLNSIIAILNDVDILLWSREALNLLLIILYFPIKKYFIEKKDVIKLLLVYSVVVTATAFIHFYTYANALNTDLKYAFELVRGMSVNQTLFTSASMFGLIFALYMKNKIRSILLIAFTVISIGGLIMSFSRTFWLFLLIGIFIIIFYLTGKQKMKLLLYSSIVSLILISSAFFLFQDKAQVVLTLIENRFVSTKSGAKDISVQARFVEYESVWRHIEEYPMAGTGLAYKFTFYNFLTQRTVRTSFIHNSYLFIMMKLGIPIMIVCFFPYIFYIIKGERYARKSDDEFFRLLSLGSFLSLVLMIVSNFTAAQIIMRESVFVTIMSFALISIVIKNFENSRKIINDNR